MMTGIGVHHRSEGVFTLARNDRSRWAGIRMADTFAPVNSVTVLLEASRGATRSASAPVVLADAGVENVNAQVDELIATASYAVCWPSRI
jgi:hypothetical protein